MYFSVPITALLLAQSTALAKSTNLGRRDLDSFVSLEKQIALQGALDNIGPDGSKVPGAGAGYVVASPSKVNPDCELLIGYFSIQTRLN